MVLSPKREKLLRSAISWLAVFSLLLNTLSGAFFAAPYAFAQEETSTPEPTATPTAEPTLEPSSEPTQEPENTPATDASPSPTPTLEASPTPEATITPTTEPEITSEPVVLAGTNTSGGDPLIEETPESEPSAELVFSLSTDKADYSPTDTVTITGTDFPRNSDLTIRVTWPDGLVRDAEGNVGSSDTVTTDENGSFVYLYPLRGDGQEGTYLVEVLMGATVLASTTFTDQQGTQFTLEQWSDEDVDTDPPEPGTAEWQPGSLNPGNSQYQEEQAVPFRLTIDNADTSVNYTLRIRYDFQSGTKRGYDYLVSYNLSRSPTVPGGPPDDTEAIPTDGSLGFSPISGNFTLWGGTFVGTPTGPIVDGDRKYYELTIDPSSTTGYLFWGGHLASPVDWGTGNGASSYTGASLHMHFGLMPGDTSSQDRSIQTNAIVPLSGSITVVKDVVPDNSSLWDFALTGPESGSATGIGDGGSHTFGGLDAGTYTLSETTDPNYSTSVSCDTGETGTDSVSVDLAAGENVTCTFTNSINPGTIIVEKQTAPDGDSQTFTFTGDAAGTISDGQQIVVPDLTPGIYTSTETVPSGWELTSIFCDDSDSSGSGTTATFNLDPGETVTCTFNNTKQGKIITQKETDPAGGPQPFTFEPSWGSDFNLTDGQSNDSGFLSPGTYSVSETVPTGWDLTSTCSDGSDPSSIGLDPGETVTCTFTNTQRGIIIVEKQTDPDGATGNFTFTGNAGGPISDNGQIIVSNLVPGQYTSTEDDPTPEFDLTAITCDDGSSATPSTWDVGTRTATFNLDPGETVKCTFTNTQRGSISGYKFEDEDGSLSTTGDQTPVAGWVIELWSCITDFNSCTDTGDTATTDSNGFFSFSNLVPGLYKLIEQILPGWTNLSPDSIEVTLDPGEEDQNNDFVNTQFGEIIVEKVTDPSGDLQSFNFTLTGGPSTLNQAFSLTDGESHNSGDVLPGSGYSIEEDVPAGWDLTDATCDDGSPVDNIEVSSSETVTCTFTNTQRGAIIVEKQTDPDGAPGDFTFTDDVIGTISDDGTIEVTNLEPGTYTATENNPTPEFDLTAITCDDGSSATPSTWDVGTRTATFNLDPGETVKCTFTNRQRGKILVDKVTDPSGDPQHFTFHLINGFLGIFQVFFLTDSATPHDSGFIPPRSGYHVSENVRDGWDLDSAVCSDQSPINNISVSPGEIVTCTFTNIKRGTIIVEKQTDPDGATGDFTFTGDVAGTISDNGTLTVPDLVPDTYTATENDPTPEFDLTGISCSDANSSVDLGTRTATFILDPGETITCTFTNTQRGSITVNKDVDSDGDGQVDLFGVVTWTWDIDGSGGYVAGTTQGVVPGTYTISEDQQPNFHVVNFTCGETNYGAVERQQIEVAPGDEIVCTFTNARDTGSVLVNKQVDTDGDGTFEGDNLLANLLGFKWGLDGEDPTKLFGLTVPDVVTGSYDVDENTVSGYHPVGWFEGEGSCEEPENTELPAEIDVNKDTTTEITLCNARDTGEIIIQKVLDEDGDLETASDQTFGEGWVFDVNGTGPDTDTLTTSPTNVNGLTTSGLIKTGEYSVVEVVQPGFALISALCFGGEDQFVGTFDQVDSVDGVEVGSNEEVLCIFINQPIVLGLNLEKSNDHESGASGGDTVTYTLVVTTTEDANWPAEVTVVDALPGGFTYVAGSATVNGTLQEPTISAGTLSWDVGTMEPGDTVTVIYQATIATDISPGTYTNLATCSGTGSFVECNENEEGEGVPVSSSVPIGVPLALSASVGGQVLGAATELPAAGAETVIVVTFLLLILAGLALRLSGHALKKGWLTQDFAKKTLKQLLPVALLLPFLLWAAVTPAKAVVDTVDISDLPTYRNTDTFKLSYSALSDDPITAQFYLIKDGHATWRTLGPVLSGSSGQVQVSGSDIYDGDGLYHFKVEINGGAATDQTSTTIDRSGPSPVQEYRREQIAPGFYRLFWKNPGDSDFNRVLIYRSTEPQFTADDSTRVGEMGGAPDAQMSWDNVGLDPNQSYFYALRAVDNAGNGSSIVADPETTIVIPGPTVQAAATVAAGEEVTALPEEGEILGEEEALEASPSPTPAEAAGGLLSQIGGFGGLPLGTIALGLVILVVLGFLFWWLLR